ncbi:MAG: hypothetical protein ACPG49_11085 [Chitinophagales bacterium]
MSSAAKKSNTNKSTSKPSSAKKGKAKSFLKRTGIIILAVLLIGGAAFFGISNMTYSEGTRAGYLIKISKKGFVFKTYEGQLNLGGVGSSGDVTAIVGNDIWEFSVGSDVVYKKLQENEGKRVSLDYKEKINAFSWQGDTNYFVVDVTPVE